MQYWGEKTQSVVFGLFCPIGLLNLGEVGMKKEPVVLSLRPSQGTYDCTRTHSQMVNFHRKLQVHERSYTKV